MAAAAKISKTLQHAAKVKHFTLAFLLREHEGKKQVLLGMKKRGFGKGKWNGFGGKVEARDKTIEDAAAREMNEESCVNVNGSDMKRKGTLLFTFPDKPEVMHVHVYQINTFTGTPIETEEMRPQWYTYDAIPYESMWTDDEIWLPHVLAGKNIIGQFDFSSDESTILDHVRFHIGSRSEKLREHMLRFLPRGNSILRKTFYPYDLKNRWSLNSMRSMRTMTVADLLKVAGLARSQKACVVPQDAPLSKAIATMAGHPDSSTLVVVDDDDRVVGLLTQHRILTHVSQHQNENWQNTLVRDAALPSKDIVHVTPEDTLQVCRAVMSLTGRGELPVLSGDSLLGVVTLTDIAALIVTKESRSDGETHSAKSDYVHLILPRKGLPKNTSLSPSVALEDIPTNKFVLHSYAMSIPHPQKVDTGGEDAFFIGTEEGIVPNRSSDVLCFGVADGVGSWFEQGISAGKYSRELMKAAQSAAIVSLTKEPHINPSEVLHAAWQNVTQNAIVGSSTACVVALDPIHGELYAVNLGDSGFLIIRDKKSDLKTAEKRGTLDGSLMRKMKNRDTDLTPAGRRKGAHVSYRSPQQLHYFNCPFQLGYFVPGSDMSDSPGPLFETPNDAVNLRVPVEDGDLIILATDGLFDNVDEETLLDIVAAQPDVESITKQLVKKAYDLSLDRKIDSPFARLAKENDKMWGGGMPDDITIISARVVKARA